MWRGRLAWPLVLLSCGEPAASSWLEPPLDACAYPSGPYGVSTLETLDNFSFERAEGEGPLSVAELRRCGQADAPALLLVRMVAGFCGTCRWSVAHSRELLADDVALLDVLVRDEEGAPPHAASARRWRERYDVEVPLVLDPDVRLRAADPALALPLFVLVDARSMRIEAVLSNPDPDFLQFRIASARAELRGEAKPEASPWPLHDGRFSRMEYDLLQAMAQPEDFAPPASPSNAFADDKSAAELGQKLFNDVSLSPSGDVSCATCHDAARAFADGEATALGVARGDRNTPSLAFAAHQPWQFWDGRADSLWSQALAPFEDPREYDSSRLHVVQRVAASYREEFESIFGPMPNVADLERFPRAGKPGEPAWEAMAPADRELVTRTFVNVGKSIEAFERTLRFEENALDRYARGATDALTDAEKEGLQAFFVAGCAQCHYGPRLTDDAFHVVRFPTGRTDGAADQGRSEGLAAYANAEFSASSRYSDARHERTESLRARGSALLVGQFKTPPLRGVAETAPYGHGGSELDLFAVSQRYGEGGLAAEDPRSLGRHEPWLPRFDVHARHRIADFLRVLSATPKR